MFHIIEYMLLVVAWMCQHYILAGAAAVIWPCCWPHRQTEPRTGRLTPMGRLSRACTTVWTINGLYLVGQLLLEVYRDNLSAVLDAFHQSVECALWTVMGLMIGMGVRFAISHYLASMTSARFSIFVRQRR